MLCCDADRSESPSSPERIDSEERSSDPEDPGDVDSCSNAEVGDRYGPPDVDVDSST